MIGFFSGGFLYNPKTNSVLLHKRDGNTTINPHKWAFFGGLGEGEETPVQAFMREMHEELGLELSVEEVIRLCDYPNLERGTHRYSFYVISEKSKDEMVLGEGADFDWIPVEKALLLDATDKTIADLKLLLETYDRHI